MKSRISTLGPEGTFSHEAVLKYNKSSEIILQNTIWDVFDSLRKKEVEYAIVPIENSVSGSVGMTYDSLMDFDLKISDEIILPVKHNLAANCEISEIKHIFCTNQAFSQCEKFIRGNIPGVIAIPCASNAKAAEELKLRKKGFYGAIVPEIPLKLHKLRCLVRNIQDSKFNVTRFVVLDFKIAQRTGCDRTSVSIYPHLDKPGLLYTLVGEFSSRRINLTKIESRPSKGRLGDYIFFIDLQGHAEDKKVKAAFKAIEKNFFLRILGSYPRQY